MDTTAKRLREAMELCGFKQSDLVEKTGISKGALSSYLSGRYVPKQTNIYLLSEALDVSEAWLMGADVSMERPAPDSKQDAISYNSVSKASVSIPVLGRVAAGIPLAAITDIVDTEEITEDLSRTGDFFALSIHGDSMEPKFSEGDVVIVRQQDDAESGDIVIAMVNGDDAVCKRLRKYRDGIELISTNPSYQPLFFDLEECQSKSVRILGKVVELRAKF